MTTVMASDDGSGRQWHARSGSRLRQGRSRAGSKQQQHKASNREDGVVFGEGHTFCCCEYNMLFLAGVLCFFWCGVLITKEKVIHTTPCATYVEKRLCTPSTSCFLGECFSSSVWVYAFLHGNTSLVIFSKQHGNVCVLYYPVYDRICREVE